MNSMSRGYHDSCEKEKRREEETCPTIIKCSCPSSTPIPVLTLGEGITNVELPLAALTLDTSCICDPVVRLDFSTNYVVPVGVSLVGGSVVLRVYKQCKHQQMRVPIGTSWTISGGLAGVEIFEASINSFTICDTDSCKDECCTYTVVATVNSIANVALGASFNNSTLTATVTCRKNCHECNKDRY